MIEAGRKEMAKPMSDLSYCFDCNAQFAASVGRCPECGSLNTWAAKARGEAAAPPTVVDPKPAQRVGDIPPAPAAGSIVVPEVGRRGEPRRRFRARFGIRLGRDADANAASEATPLGITRTEKAVAFKVVNGQLACPGCETSYPVTAPSCPHCGNENPVKEMEKLYGGPLPGLGGTADG